MNVSVSQAMACGLPVVTTRHSGLPEQVQDGLNGKIVPEGDWRALADAIIELIEHPAHWASMGDAGRIRAQEKYDSNVLIERQIGIYRMLIDRDGKIGK